MSAAIGSTGSAPAVQRGILSRLAADRRGGSAITFALVLPTMIGFIGLGVDTGVWYTQKRRAQTAADAAAISGALQRARGEMNTIHAAGNREIARHAIAGATVTINNPPLTGAYAGETRSVEVLINQPQDMFFSGMFLQGGPNARVRSVARVQTTGSACVLALDPGASRALQIQGSTVVNMPNCVLASNSTAVDATYTSGSSTLVAESLWSAGGIQFNGSQNSTLEDPIVDYAWPLEDPYAGKNVGTVPPGCIETNAAYQNTTVTINPGTYCDGIRFRSNSIVTLNPGVYYINRGDIEVHATARIRCNCSTGNGVTLVFTSTGAASDIGTIRINGGADVQLSAPTNPAAPFSGILMYQDRRANTSDDAILNGGSNMKLSGALYFPRQEIQYAGNNTTNGMPSCTQIIARLVTFVGNSTIVNTGCEAAGITPIEITGVRIVE